LKVRPLSGGWWEILRFSPLLGYFLVISPLWFSPGKGGFQEKKGTTGARTFPVSGNIQLVGSFYDYAARGPIFDDYL